MKYGNNEAGENKTEKRGKEDKRCKRRNKERKGKSEEVKGIK